MKNLAKYLLVCTAVVAVGLGSSMYRKTRDYAKIHNVIPSSDRESMVIVYSAKDKDGIKEGKVFLNGHLYQSFGSWAKPINELKDSKIIVGRFGSRKEASPLEFEGNGRDTVKLVIEDMKGNETSDLEKVVF